MLTDVREATAGRETRDGDLLIFGWITTSWQECGASGSDVWA